MSGPGTVSGVVKDTANAVSTTVKKAKKGDDIAASNIVSVGAAGIAALSGFFALKGSTLAKYVFGFSGITAIVAIFAGEGAQAEKTAINNIETVSESSDPTDISNFDKNDPEKELEFFEKFKTLDESATQGDRKAIMNNFSLYNTHQWLQKFLSGKKALEKRSTGSETAEIYYDKRRKLNKDANNALLALSESESQYGRAALFGILVDRYIHPDVRLQAGELLCSASTGNAQLVYNQIEEPMQKDRWFKYRKANDFLEENLLLSLAMGDKLEPLQIAKLVSHDNPLVVEGATENLFRQLPLIKEKPVVEECVNQITRTLLTSEEIRGGYSITPNERNITVLLKVLSEDDFKLHGESAFLLLPIMDKLEQIREGGYEVHPVKDGAFGINDAIQKLQSLLDEVIVLKTQNKPPESSTNMVSELNHLCNQTKDLRLVKALQEIAQGEREGFSDENRVEALGFLEKYVTKDSFIQTLAFVLPKAEKDSKLRNAALEKLTNLFTQLEDENKVRAGKVLIDNGRFEEVEKFVLEVSLDPDTEIMKANELKSKILQLLPEHNDASYGILIKCLDHEDPIITGLSANILTEALSTDKKNREEEGRRLSVSLHELNEDRTTLTPRYDTFIGVVTALENPDFKISGNPGNLRSVVLGLKRLGSETASYVGEIEIFEPRDLLTDIHFASLPPKIKALDSSETPKLTAYYIKQLELQTGEVKDLALERRKNLLTAGIRKHIEASEDGKKKSEEPYYKKFEKKPRGPKFQSKANKPKRK